MSEDTNQNKQPEMRWYTLHVYSTMEKSVAKAIQDRIDHSDLKQYFGEVLLPIEKVQENRNGRKYESERRMYPGYVFVEMVMNEDTWHLMNSTPRVIEFLGNNNPVPLSQREIDGIKGRMNVGTGEKPVRRFFLKWAKRSASRKVPLRTSTAASKKSCTTSRVCAASCRSSAAKRALNSRLTKSRKSDLSRPFGRTERSGPGGRHCGPFFLRPQTVVF